LLNSQVPKFLQSYQIAPHENGNAKLGLTPQPIAFGTLREARRIGRMIVLPSGVDQTMNLTATLPIRLPRGKAQL
jgi:hypothetical protein